MKTVLSAKGHHFCHLHGRYWPGSMADIGQVQRPISAKFNGRYGHVRWPILANVKGRYWPGSRADIGQVQWPILASVKGRYWLGSMTYNDLIPQSILTSCPSTVMNASKPTDVPIGPIGPPAAERWLTGQQAKGRGLPSAGVKLSPRRPPARGNNVN